MEVSRFGPNHFSALDLSVFVNNTKEGAQKLQMVPLAQLHFGFKFLREEEDIGSLTSSKIEIMSSYKFKNNHTHFLLPNQTESDTSWRLKIE